MQYSVSKITSAKGRAAKQGVTVKKKITKQQIKTKAFNIAISFGFYLILFFACFASVNTKSLWYETLLKPAYMPLSWFFLAVNILIAIAMVTVFYICIEKGNKTQIINIAINAGLTVLLFYMFFMLKSMLGSIVIVAVLISQTITILCGFIKNDMALSIILSVIITWQVYLTMIIYALLMLN